MIIVYSMSIVHRFLWCFFHWWIRLRGSQSGGLFGATVPWRSRSHGTMPWTGGAPQNGEDFTAPHFLDNSEMIYGVYKFVNYRGLFHGKLGVPPVINLINIYFKVYKFIKVDFMDVLGKSHLQMFISWKVTINGWLGVKPYDLGHIHICLGHDPYKSTILANMVIYTSLLCFWAMWSEIGIYFHIFYQ